MNDLLAVIPLVILGFLLALPHFRMPPDDHFADYTSWALFRRAGEPLPAYFTLLNQGGFTRIFLYHLAAVMLSVAGRRNLLVTLRLLAVTLNTGVGILIYVISMHFMGLGWASSFVGSLLYLFISTRLQFELVKYNPEIFEVAGEMLGVLFILWFWPQNMESCWRLLPVFMWLFFLGLNCKILFCANVIALGTGVFLATGFPLIIIPIVGASGILAIILFLLIFKNASLSHLRSLQRYLNRFSQDSIWLNFKATYRYYYYKTPLLPFTALYAVSLALTWGKPYFPMFSLWSFSSICIVAAQKRFCTYLFLITFAPMAMIITQGIDALWRLNPGLLAIVIITFSYFSRISIRDFNLYYKAMPLIDKLKLIYGPVYWQSSYDFRVEDVVAHIKAHPGPFMVINTSLMAHYLTDTAPIVLVSTMIYDAHLMFSDRQTLILKNIRKIKPRWIYDFSGSFYGQHTMNPLTLFLATGIGYAPCKRQDNVLYFEISCIAEPRWTRNHNAIHLYMLHSISFDTLQSQLLFHEDVVLPLFFQRDIESICEDLAKGMPGSNWEVSQLIEDHLNGELGIAGLYLAANRLFRGETKRARCILTNWEHTSSELIVLYPALGFTYIALQLLSETPDCDCRWPEIDALERTQLHEGFRQITLCETLLKSDLQENAKRRLLTIINRTREVKALPYYIHSPEYNKALNAIKSGVY